MELLKAGSDDLQTIWKMQVEAFSQLYEKLGYHQTGKTEVINDRMTLVFYEKD